MDFRYDYLKMRETLQFFIYDNWTSPAALLNTSLDGKDNCTILELGPRNKNSKKVWVVAKSAMRKGAPLFLSYGIGSSHYEKIQLELEMEATEKETEILYEGEKKMPVITRQSAAHDAVRHNKAKKEKKLEQFLRVQRRL